MTEELKPLVFRFSELNDTEVREALTLVEDDVIRNLYKKLSVAKQTGFVDSRGFRVENIPVPRILASLIKGVISKNVDAYTFANTAMYFALSEKPIYAAIREYKENKDLDHLFKKVKDEILEHDLKIQPLTLIKLSLDDDLEIPDYMKEVLEIHPKKTEPIISRATPENKANKAKSKPKKDDPNTDKEQVQLLKKELSDLKDKHKRELDLLKRDQEGNFNKYLENIRLKINQMISFAADVEITKHIEKKELKTVEQVWEYLQTLENEIGQNLDSSDNRRNLQRIAVMKFMVLAGKEDN